MGGGGFGRVIGIIGAGIGAVESLLSIGGAHPFGRSASLPSACWSYTIW
jgi:hypothetical protein